MGLPINNSGITDLAEVIHCDVLNDVNLSCVLIHLNECNMTAKGECKVFWIPVGNHFQSWIETFRKIPCIVQGVGNLRQGHFFAGIRSN